MGVKSTGGQNVGVGVLEQDGGGGDTGVGY